MAEFWTKSKNWNQDEIREAGMEYEYLRKTGKFLYEVEKSNISELLNRNNADYTVLIPGTNRTSVSIKAEVQELESHVYTDNAKAKYAAIKEKMLSQKSFPTQDEFEEAEKAIIWAGKGFGILDATGKKSAAEMEQEFYRLKSQRQKKEETVTVQGMYDRLISRAQHTEEINGKDSIPVAILRDEIKAALSQARLGYEVLDRSGKSPPLKMKQAFDAAVLKAAKREATDAVLQYARSSDHEEEIRDKQYLKPPFQSSYSGIVYEGHDRLPDALDGEWNSKGNTKFLNQFRIAGQRAKAAGLDLDSNHDGKYTEAELRAGLGLKPEPIPTMSEKFMVAAHDAGRAIYNSPVQVIFWKQNLAERHRPFEMH